MATKDLHNAVHVVQGIYPAAITGAKAADNAADLSLGNPAGGAVGAGPCESAEIVFAIGAVTGTTPTATPVIEESADNVTYTAVAAADLIGGALPANFDSTYANSVVKRGYRGTLQYVRARISATGGTSPSFTMGCAIVLSHPRHLPTPSTN